jgi:threonine dehydrogenase-like Zn-dependent dehydrogenase
MSGSPAVTGQLPDVMAAAVYRSPGVIAVEERPLPPPGPDQLVVKVSSCGICGSDIHQLRDGWGFKPGAVAGHEWTGTIAAVGSDVQGWSPGER